MTAQTTTRLRALLDAATPGPWKAEEYESMKLERRWDIHRADSITLAEMGYGMLEADAALIVYLVNHGAAIADFIEAAQTLRDYGTTGITYYDEPYERAVDAALAHLSEEKKP